MRPREAAEVARFQAKKNRSKILKSAIFELHKCYTPQNPKTPKPHSDFKFSEKILDLKFRTMSEIKLKIRHAKRGNERSLDLSNMGLTEIPIDVV